MSTGTIIIGAQALGAGVGIISALNQAEAQKAQGEIARRNFDEAARLERLKADEAIELGEEQALRVSGRVRQVLGAQQSALAAQGIQVDTGTALDLQADALRFGQADILTIRFNALRQAFGFQTSAGQLALQGRLEQISGRAQAAQTIATAGARVGQQLGQTAQLAQSGFFNPQQPAPNPTTNGGSAFRFSTSARPRA